MTKGWAFSANLQRRRFAVDLPRSSSSGPEREPPGLAFGKPEDRLREQSKEPEDPCRNITHSATVQADPHSRLAVADRFLAPGDVSLQRLTHGRVHRRLDIFLSAFFHSLVARTVASSAPASAQAS